MTEFVNRVVLETLAVPGATDLFWERNQEAFYTLEATNTGNTGSLSGAELNRSSHPRR